MYKLLDELEQEAWFEQCAYRHPVVIMKQGNMSRPDRIAEPSNYFLTFPVTAHSRVAEQYAHKSS